MFVTAGGCLFGALRGPTTDEGFKEATPLVRFKNVTTFD